MIRVLSLGAGVQSTTAALMSALGELPKIDHAIFADTQWEPRSVYEHMARLKPFLEQHNIPVHIVTGGDIRANFTHGQNPDGGKGTKACLHAPVYTVADDNSLGLSMRSCTDKYKIVPLDRKVAELIGKRPGERWPLTQAVEQWFGISLDEIQRMRVSQRKAIVYRYPLIERRMTRGDCLEWLKRQGWSAPRSACIGCPYHSDHEWRRLTAEEFADAVAVEREMQANKKPSLRGVPYLHRSCKPLDQVDLSTAEDRGQGNLFGVAEHECAGMCGV